MSPNEKKWVYGIAWILLAIVAVLPARAQDVASLTGVVTDASGGSISDVLIKLVDKRTAAARIAHTGTDGSEARDGSFTRSTRRHRNFRFSYQPYITL